MTDENKTNEPQDQVERAEEEAARAAAAAEEAVEAAPETPEAVEAVEAAEVAAEAAEEAAKAPKAKRAAKARKAEQAADEAEDAAEEAVAAAEKPKRSRAKKKPEPEAEEPAKPAAAPAKPAATPAPSRRRNGAVPAGVEVRAQAKYVRTSARKARLVCDHIRGKDVEEARAILAFTPRGAAKAWSKLLDSAVANAEHNHELVGEELRIAAVYADEGPTLKRFRPRAMGRATRIRKRTSHLTITLTPKG
jgi:ribosomal protein L22